MPELPEVEVTRRLFEANCVGKKIVTVDAVEDEKVFDGATPADLTATLLGATPRAALRLGKHMWLDLGPDTPYVLIHLGMSGGTAVRGVGGAAYQRYTIDADAEAPWPPRFAKLSLIFADGTEWAFCDARRFGRVRLGVAGADPLASPPLSALANDPLLSWPNLTEFKEQLGAQRRAIKAVLLDQSFSAGVGNWVADEVLYQARIHPEQPAVSLSGEEAAALHRLIPEICQIAVDAGAEAERLPTTWLFPHRWGKGNAEKNRVGGHVVDHVTVGGRTSAFVPAVQKLRKSSGGGGGGSKGGGKRGAAAEVAPPAKAKKVAASAPAVEKKPAPKAKGRAKAAPKAPAAAAAGTRRVTRGASATPSSPVKHI
jgi:formamidopyrimidine-DNA glycosylase